MNCPLCGQVSLASVCGCHSEPPPTASPDCGEDAAASDLRAIPALPNPQPHAGVEPPSNEESPAWRNELSARLDRYRSRRKIRPPRYPSLRLPFDPADLSPRAETGSRAVPRETFDPASDRALALSDLRHLDPEAQTDVRPPQSPPEFPGAKILEFPRSAWAPPSPQPDQLAEPVGERLRILDVPETAPPAPALGGITIEPAAPAEPEKRPGIDLPLQSASLARRAFASMMDGLIVCTATALFGAIFWKVAGVRPPQLQLLGLAVGIQVVFWAGYQYLLNVYSGRTPGLRLAGLELSRFDGSSTPRSLRRWRVLASYLSAASLGMGYLWVFLDEDLLCWHDRITRTHLAPIREMPRT